MSKQRKHINIYRVCRKIPILYLYGTKGEHSLLFAWYVSNEDLEPYFSEPSNESLALDASEKLLAMYIAYCKKRSFQDESWVNG